MLGPVSSEAAKKAYEKLNPDNGDEGAEEGSADAGDGKKPAKPGQRPAKPEADAEEGTESGDNAAGAEDGTGEEIPDQSGRSSMDEIYDLFRQFMDQYH